MLTIGRNFQILFARSLFYQTHRAFIRWSMGWYMATGSSWCLLEVPEAHSMLCYASAGSGWKRLAAVSITLLIMPPPHRAMITAAGVYISIFLAEVSIFDHDSFQSQRHLIPVSTTACMPRRQLYLTTTRGSQTRSVFVWLPFCHPIALPSASTSPVCVALPCHTGSPSSHLKF